MKKYHLFTLIVLALSFSCNSPSPDDNNVSEATDDKEMLSQTKRYEERVEVRKQKKAERRQERQKEKGSAVITDGNQITQRVIAKLSSMVELTEDQKKQVDDIIANSALNTFDQVDTKAGKRELRKAKKELQRKFLSILTEEQVAQVKEVYAVKEAEKEAIRAEKERAAHAAKREKSNR